VTREHKLALIVGFSLILLVGVLISDHLSRARQAQVGPVTTHEAQVSDTSFPAPVDPIKAIENAPRPQGVPQLVPERQVAAAPTDGGAAPLSPNAGGFVPDPTGRAGPLTDALGGGGAPGPIIHEPTLPARTALQVPTHEMIMRKDTADRDLIREVVAQGGTAEEHDGVIVLTPKALAQTQKPGAPAKPEAQTAKADPRPPAAALKTYTIQKGDNLSKLAAREYGDGKLWAKLAKFNGITNEDGIVQLGQSIKLPSRDLLLGKPAATNKPEMVSPSPSTTPPPARPREPGPVKPQRTELAKAAPSPKAPKNKTLGTNEPAVTYTVKKGETLGDIAKRTLGSSKRWPELAEFNKLDDEDNIPAGTVLKVPPMRG
jgi:nucleoid-associated protein YgaU